MHEYLLKAGALVAHYKIVSPIGAGGMGEVYLADDIKLGRQVALKVLRGDISNETEQVARFLQEARAASALNHPNILTVYESGRFQSSHYIATELIRGQTLRDRLEKEPLMLGEALDILLQTTAALGAAHAEGIIHRDIKPENVMLRNDGLVKVLDFGLAKPSPVGAGAGSIETTLAQINTEPGVLIGTVAYMSPEQARGRKIDVRSDIFSLGIMMFEMLTGKRPFEGESHLDLVSAILRDDAPLLRQVSPDLPQPLERIVEKTLRKDRELRYQHVKDLHIDIADVKNDLEFEQKLMRSGNTGRAAAAHTTNPTKLRSAFTTGVSATPRFTLLHALIFAALAAAVVAAVWFLRPGAGVSAIPGSFKTTELASWIAAPGELFGTASYSPDGRMIAFASTRSGKKDIWITQATSTEALRITTDEFANIDPVWSPRGDEIAYLSQRPDASGALSTGIWRVAALGGAPRLVVAAIEGGSILRRWTPSGKLYYQSRGDLHSVDLSTGSTQKAVSPGQAGSVWMDVAPDEKEFLYAINGDNVWQVFRSEMGSGSSVEVAGGRGRLNARLAWIAEKRRLFYSTTTDGIREIFAATIGGSEKVLLSRPEGNTTVVDASADGRSVILGSAREESNLWRVNLADGRESAAARDINIKLFPAAASDNHRIVFQSVKGPSVDRIFEGNIVVQNSVGGEKDRPVVLSSSGFMPVWSPDSSSIAYLKAAGKDVELAVVGASGGAERRLASGQIWRPGYSTSPYNLTHPYSLSWSPDGSRIAYILERDGVSNVMAVSVGDGTDANLSNNSDTGTIFECPIWSSDGKYIAFSFRRRTKDQDGRVRRGLKIIDVPANAVKDVFETTRPMRLVGWSADERGLIVAEPDKENVGVPPETKLSRVSLADGSEASIAALKNVYFYNIFLSHDRKQIAYAARDQDVDNLWVLASNGGKARRLTNHNDSGQHFSRLTWLPDGSGIVFGKQTRFSLLSIMTDIE